MKRAVSTFSIDTLWDYNLYLIAAFPLFPKAVQSISMLLFFVLSVVLFIKKKDFKIAKLAVVKVLLFSSVFLMYLIGVLCSENKEEAFGFVVKTAPLLMFPLAIGILTKHKVNREKLRMVLSVYIAALALTLFWNHLYLSFTTSALSNWEYRLAFEKYTNVHGTYFAIWIAFGIFILISKAFRAHKIKLFFVCSLIAYFVFWQIVIGARLPFVTTSLLVFAYLIHKIRDKKKKVYLLVSIVIVAICFIFFNHKQLIEKVDFSLPKGDYHLQHETMTSEHIRGGIYFCSSKLILKKWLFGYGIGDVNDQLDTCYKEEIDSNVYQIKQYNAHNQYLQIFLSSGVIGGLIFILSILFGMRYAYRQKIMGYLAFSVLVATCFLTENILSRHDGVLFYAFFNSIFIFYSKNARTS